MSKEKEEYLEGIGGRGRARSLLRAAAGVVGGDGGVGGDPKSAVKGGLRRLTEN